MYRTNQAGHKSSKKSFEDMWNEYLWAIEDKISWNHVWSERINGVIRKWNRYHTVFKIIQWNYFLKPLQKGEAVWLVICYITQMVHHPDEGNKWPSGRERLRQEYMMKSKRKRWTDCISKRNCKLTKLCVEEKKSKKI